MDGSQLMHKQVHELAQKPQKLESEEHTAKRQKILDD